MRKFLSVIFLAGLMCACGGNKSADNAQADDAVAGAEDNIELFNADKVDIGVVDLNDDEALRPDIKTNHLIVVDFNAVWCGPCQQFKPAFEAAAEKFAGQVEFVSVDVDNNPNTAKAFGVQGIPHVAFIIPGQEEVKNYVGTGELLPDSVFFNLIEQNL